MASETPLTPQARRALVRGIIKALAFFTLEGAILFLASGRLDWAWAWIFLGFSLAVAATGTFIMVRHHPSLIEERVSAFKKGGRWDKPLVIGMAVVCPILLCLVAGLDERFGWSYRPGLAARCVALAAAAAGHGLALWAIKSNRFFSSMVRIQTERGHSVQSGGPYRFVRHPGYAGWAPSFLALPIVLGSLWAFIPAGAAMGLVVVRTVLEDGLLRHELSGYAEYAARVRFRLIPGVW